MREDVKAFVALAAGTLEIAEPIVEVGAYQVPGQERLADLRAAFAGKRYLGCDIVPGPGVDCIEDIHQLSFADNSVGTVVAVETLEHVADPYRAVAEIHRVLRPGGVLIVSMPFNFPIHYMPDYLRLTPEGLARLLSAFSAAAVFAAGDAQHPATVYGLALKGGTDTDAVQFEAAVTRLQTAWVLNASPDPLIRFTPLVSVLRWDAPDRGTGDLTLDRRIEQSFVCTLDGLTRIDVKFDLGGSLHPATVQFTLADTSGRQLAAVEMPTRYIPHERWIAFQFPTLPSSAGQRFRFTLHGSEPGTKTCALASTRTSLPGSTLSVEGTPRSGTLSFEAFCVRPAGLSPVLAAGGTDSPTRDVAGESALLAAARIHAAELHHTAAQLHAEIGRLRSELADVSRRVDGVDVAVVDALAATLRRYGPVRALLRLVGRRDR
jgi:SAM-dependent methyltransferase